MVWSYRHGRLRVSTNRYVTLAYLKYSHGYKDGAGYYGEGANTVLNASPFTKAEHVDSFEAGIKRSFGSWLTANLALFHYQYENLQIPLSTVLNQGGITLAQSAFFNVPGSYQSGTAGNSKRRSGRRTTSRSCSTIRTTTRM